ncbi:hypothetical protein WA026_012013 [Henosepilachna vigintioctopunctata]|uniref:Signal recognition particle receptor subunit beta n=1 Tax=Henosepilachna vigintioctopunctata TaxID=420089 RepID=A0AAW1VAM6_9CUCU
MESYNYFREISIAFLVILLTIVFFLIYKRGKSSRRGIILVGLCDSGKTLIFSQLIHKKYIQTFTSIKDNVGGFVEGDAFLKIIDIPGHERLRYKFFDEHKLSARGIVFVIDSLTFVQDLKDAAEFLYNILSDDILTRNKTNILILCNKQDQTLAKGSTAIRSILEKELNTLQMTKSRQVESVDGKISKKSSLGNNEHEFSFQNFQLNVEFAECFANHSKNGTSDIDQLKKWLLKIA